jgi:hypothetical protein
MLLPKSCSFKINDNGCQIPPSYVVSIKAKKEEYMIGVVCNDHMEEIEQRFKSLQLLAKLPGGNINFEPIKVVSTDCIKGGYNDYVEVELQRNNNQG